MKISTIKVIVNNINASRENKYQCIPIPFQGSDQNNLAIPLVDVSNNNTTTVDPAKTLVYYLVGEADGGQEKSFPLTNALKKKGVKGYDLILAIERVAINNQMIYKERIQQSTGTFAFNDANEGEDGIEPIFSRYFAAGEKDFFKIDYTELKSKKPTTKFNTIFIKIPKIKKDPPDFNGIKTTHTNEIKNDIWYDETNGIYYDFKNLFCFNKNNNTCYDGKDDVWYDITNLLTYLTIADSRTYKNFVYSTPIFKADAAETRSDVTVDWAHNMLVHGAPGTGKSFTVNKNATEKFGKNVRRVTFYEDYSYEKFVGAYMPVQDVKTTKLSFDDKKGCAEGEGIAYKFKPGIMANILAEAYAELIIAKNKSYFDNHQNDKENNTDQDQSFSLSELYKINDDDEVKPQEFCLIVEEINRAPAASVFGDFFQLLDRDKNGLSTYSISISDEFKDWFVDRVTELCKKHYDNSTDASIFEIARKTTELVADNLRLPPNLYIWTTMNSADQGVFPLDTAFKRRWCYMYMSVDKNRETEMKIKIPYNSKINEKNWDVFRNAINAAIQAAGCIEEDRLIGTWYFNDNDFAANDKLFDNFNKTDVNKRYSMINPLCDKLFAYLRNDVFRNNPESFFSKEYTTMSKIREGIVNGISLGVIIKNFSIAESAPSGSDSANTSGNGETPAQSPEITTTQAENQTSGE